jgi:hypothetical protein
MVVVAGTIRKAGEVRLRFPKGWRRGESLKYLVRVIRRMFVGDSTNFTCRSVTDGVECEGSLSVKGRWLDKG